MLRRCQHWRLCSSPFLLCFSWRQNCSVQCLYIVVMVQTNTGWHEMVKAVKAALLVATIQRNPLPAPAPETLTIQYLLAPIGMVHKGSVCVCVCVCVCVGADLRQVNKGSVCVGDREGKIKSDSGQLSIKPQVFSASNAEGFRVLLMFFWLSEQKRKKNKKQSGSFFCGFSSILWGHRVR